MYPSGSGLGERARGPAWENMCVYGVWGLASVISGNFLPEQSRGVRGDKAGGGVGNLHHQGCNGHPYSLDRPAPPCGGNSWGRWLLRWLLFEKGQDYELLRAPGPDDLRKLGRQGCWPGGEGPGPA